MTLKFRHLSRESVDRARAELASGDGSRLSVAANGECVWRPMLEEVQCPGQACEQVFKVSPGDLILGTRMACQACGENFEFGLALFSEEPSAGAASRDQSTL